LKIFSAQNCAPASSNLLPQAQEANWSPDGKRLLVLDGTSKAEVLDASTGRVIASFTGKDSGDFVSQSVWSSNGTQILSEVIQFPTKTSSIVSVQIWNASTGAFIRTALTFNTDIQLPGVSENAWPISSNGKYNAIQKSNNSIEIWNIETGKMVSSIPFNQPGISAMAWSPDGASLALGLPNASQVQIWSTATGQLSSTFKDSDTWAMVIGALAWSPNGKYLAESTSAIHIWDVKAQKVVATFGRVDKVHWVATLAWSPESNMLTSSTVHVAGPGDQTHNTVHIWKLS
jgi:WD40 repeat protein